MSCAFVALPISIFSKRDAHSNKRVPNHTQFVSDYVNSLTPNPWRSWEDQKRQKKKNTRTALNNPDVPNEIAGVRSVIMMSDERAMMMARCNYLNILIARKISMESGTSSARRPHRKIGSGEIMDFMTKFPFFPQKIPRFVCVRHSQFFLILWGKNGKKVVHFPTNQLFPQPLTRKFHIFPLPFL